MEKQDKKGRQFQALAQSKMDWAFLKPEHAG